MSTFQKGDILKVAVSNGLSLRDGPDGRMPIIRRLTHEEQVEVLSMGEEQFPPEWVQVRAGNNLGWILPKSGDELFVKKIEPVKPKRATRKRKATKKQELPSEVAEEVAVSLDFSDLGPDETHIPAPKESLPSLIVVEDSSSDEPGELGD